MGHLGAEELIDLAESARPEASVPHLRSCERCRRRLADLRAALPEVHRHDVPEPAPLFWEHFSARVHEAVAAEGLPRSASWLDLWGRPRLTMISVAGACAVLAVAAVVSLGHGFVRGDVAMPAPSVASVAPVAPVKPVKPVEPVKDDAPDADLMALAEDPSLDLVADLAAQVEWDMAGETGLETHEATSDSAVGQLTAVERRELQRLLKEELAHTGA